MCMFSFSYCSSIYTENTVENLTQKEFRWKNFIEKFQRTIKKHQMYFVCSPPIGIGTSFFIILVLSIEFSKNSFWKNLRDLKLYWKQNSLEILSPKMVYRKTTKKNTLKKITKTAYLFLSWWNIRWMNLIWVSWNSDWYII